MLHKQTTTPFLYETLEKLMVRPEFKDFRLAGGTGLSLQFGHRRSIDIDLFTDKVIPIEDYKRIIRKTFPTAEIRTLSFGLTFYIADEKKELKVDVMETDPFIRPVKIIENIRLAQIEDIAAMKLNAITSRNTKKDFFDIAELLQRFTLDELLTFYLEKFPYNDIKDVLENLTFFSEDCENDFDPDILNATSWVDVKFLLQDIFDEYINNQLYQ